MFTILKSYFPRTMVSSEVRLLALAITLINIAPAFFGLMWFFTVLPLIGLAIFWEQAKLVIDRDLSIEVDATATLSIIYNSFLLIGIILIGGKGIYLYGMITYLAGIIGLNMLLIRVHKESIIENRKKDERISQYQNAPEASHSYNNLI